MRTFQNCLIPVKQSEETHFQMSDLTELPIVKNSIVLLVFEKNSNRCDVTALLRRFLQMQRMEALL